MSGIELFQNSLDCGKTDPMYFRSYGWRFDVQDIIETVLKDEKRQALSASRPKKWENNKPKERTGHEGTCFVDWNYQQAGVAVVAAASLSSFSALHNGSILGHLKRNISRYRYFPAPSVHADRLFLSLRLKRKRENKALLRRRRAGELLIST